MQGQVQLGGGNDVAQPGASQDLIWGDAGTDTLDFRGQSPVTVSLSVPSRNKGVAQGDSYTGFENLIGTSGTDDLAGNGAANSLSGQGGADTLRAGAGADGLTGGTGNDVFVFESRYDTDRVRDFANASGNNDRIQILRSAFGLTDAAGAVKAECFVVRADNRALERDDHLIFRTTDRSLWVDVDGSGSKAAIKLAVFDGSTLLTLNDLSFL
jgi:Ca2+-binding RTX toxin-like protein